MADSNDAFDARRAFRQRLAAIAWQYPELTTPAARERLAMALDQETEETSQCPENPPADPQDGP